LHENSQPKKKEKKEGEWVGWKKKGERKKRKEKRRSNYLCLRRIIAAFFLSRRIYSLVERLLSPPKKNRSSVGRFMGPVPKPSKFNA
jgi:hypothetical protein